jgi:Flp pilus assembly CpaE family ATPase
MPTSASYELQRKSEKNMPEETELSVLLIEDEPDAARLIQHVLTKGNGAPVTVDWAADLSTGLERLAERDFQAVLLDLNLPDSTGFDTFACVRRSAPDLAVVVLTGHEDEELALQAVRAGADEYLIKSDIRDRFLAQRIRYAVERNRLRRQDDRSVRSGQILTFIGAKGGVGTTTLAVNLAAALAKGGKTSLAIELTREYGSFAAILNRTSAWGISAVLRNEADAISRDTVASAMEDLGGGFRALCAPPWAETASPVSPAQARALLGIARGLADFVIVDLPSTSAPLIAEVVRHSTFTTLVVERNRLGLNAALARIKDLQSQAVHPSNVGAILVNKTPFLEFLTPPEFGKRLGCGVVGVVPPAGGLYTSSEADPLPVVAHPETTFGHGIQELAARLSSGTVRYLAA